MRCVMIPKPSRPRRRLVLLCVMVWYVLCVGWMDDPFC